MPWSTWVRVKAPLIPEVALVELPPMKSKPHVRRAYYCSVNTVRTVLVEKKHIATSEVYGMGSAQAGNCASVSAIVYILTYRIYLRPAPTTMTLSGMVFMEYGQ